MPPYEKQLSEKILLDSLRRMGDRFFPVRIGVAETGKELKESGHEPDALAEISWDQETFEFAVEARIPFHPKAIQEAVQRAQTFAKQLQVYPLLIVPYLSDEQLRVLEAQQVSGLDLCGNGILVIPDRLLVYRTGNPNKYPSSSPIRNVHRGTSSLVVRAFLLRPEYKTSQELLDEVTKRGGEVTLPTVSKACSSLAGEPRVWSVLSGSCQNNAALPHH